MELLLGDTADALDNLGRVAREVALEEVDHAAGVLERRVALDLADHHPRAGALLEGLRRVLAPAGRRGDLAALVHPGARVVHAFLGVEAAEVAAEVLRVLELLV